MRSIKGKKKITLREPENLDPSCGSLIAGAVLINSTGATRHLDGSKMKVAAPAEGVVVGCNPAPTPPVLWAGFIVLAHCGEAACRRSNTHRRQLTLGGDSCGHAQLVQPSARRLLVPRLATRRCTMRAALLGSWRAAGSQTAQPGLAESTRAQRHYLPRQQTQLQPRAPHWRAAERAGRA